MKTFTGTELYASLCNATQDLDESFFKPIANKFGVTVSDVECAAACVEGNLEEALNQYPSDNQFYINEASALGAFTEYLNEWLVHSK